MDISVMIPSGEDITLTVDPTARIEDVKTMIQKKKGIPSDTQRFLFAGRQLEDGKTLQDYGVTKSAKFHLILRLHG
jgi:ubiquitin